MPSIVKGRLARRPVRMALVSSPSADAPGAFWRNYGQKRRAMGDTPDSLGERLKALREAAHESQEDVAKQIPVNAGTYSRWERGTSKPHADQIAKLAIDR